MHIVAYKNVIVLDRVQWLSFSNGANDYEQTILSSAQIDVSYNGILQWFTR